MISRLNPDRKLLNPLHLQIDINQRFGELLIEHTFCWMMVRDQVQYVYICFGKCISYWKKKRFLSNFQFSLFYISILISKQWNVKICFQICFETDIWKACPITFLTQVKEGAASVLKLQAVRSMRLMCVGGVDILPMLRYL